jgi:hypothetical protein
MFGRRPGLLLLISIVFAAAFAVAGCGDSKSNDAPVELEDTLGFSREGQMELQSRVENETATCMKNQGFDYVPVDPFAQQQALTGKARLSDEDFIKEFGYGISTLFGRGNAQADPNERIRSSLGPADKAAYDRALGGDNPGATFSEAVDSGDFSDLGGCTKEATDKAFGGTDLLSSLVGKLDELDERIVQDQRMVNATEKWSVCMKDQGFSYEEPDAIDEDLTRRFKAIVGSGTRPGATKAADAGVKVDQAALTNLQREEVKIANADSACEKKEITPVERKVRPQYEKQFRQQNQSLLARVKKPNASGQ